jgi:hypothetical protein
MMTAVTKELVFKRGDKVAAAVDLPHVPQGTKGRVLYVAGMTWFRYHVEFENGQVISSVDATLLTAADEWDRQQYEEKMAARAAAREAALAERRAQQKEAASAGSDR